MVCVWRGRSKGWGREVGGSVARPLPRAAAYRPASLPGARASSSHTLTTPQRAVHAALRPLRRVPLGAWWRGRVLRWVRRGLLGTDGQRRGMHAPITQRSPPPTARREGRGAGGGQSVQCVALERVIEGAGSRSARAAPWRVRTLWLTLAVYCALMTPPALHDTARSEQTPPHPHTHTVALSSPPSLRMLPGLRLPPPPTHTNACALGSPAPFSLVRPAVLALVRDPRPCSPPAQLEAIESCGRRGAVWLSVPAP